VFSFPAVKDKRVFFIYIFFFLLFTLSIPQDSYCDQAPKELNRALSSYTEGNYLEALTQFQKLALDFPQDSHFSIFKLMIAKCQYHLGHLSRAEESFRNFLEEFPKSRFLPICHFYLGNIKYTNGEFFSSALEFIQAYEHGDKKTKKMAFESLLLLLKNNLDRVELEKLVKETEGNDIYPEVLFLWGQKELKMGNYSEAEKIFQSYLDLYPQGQRAKDANEFSKKASRFLEEGISIGILAPTSGPYAEYGESMIRGIRLAVEGSDRKVKLFIRDTRGDPVQATLVSRKLIEEDQVSAILGPLRSECTIGASATAQNYKVPLITPTSNQEGIADIGDFIFQLSPSSQKIGEKLAQFAAKKIDIKEVVILSPDDSYGENACLGFVEKIKEAGVRILAKEIYAPGSTDFGPQLKKIREILWDEKMEREGGFDSTKYVDRFGEPIPVDDIPVEVDAFFLPIYPEDVALIAPQIAFFKIQTKLLGTEGWSQKEVLNLSQQFTDGLVFASDFCLEESNPSGRNFKKDFELLYKKSPDKVAFLSYDALRILLASLKNAFTSESIKCNLLGIRGFKGTGGEIGFNSNGENTNIGIYLFENGEIKRLQ
jgi:branched-chain amino acid transport system substrate-binding protein